MAVNLLQSEQVTNNILVDIISMAAHYFSAFITAVGVITIIFAVLEKTIKVTDDDLKLMNKDWDPKNLPKGVEEHNKVKIYQKIVGICVIVLVFIILNFYSEKIGIVYTSTPSEGWNFIPVFNYQIFKEYIPLWNILLGLSLILNIVLIKEGRWSKSTHILSIMISIYNMVLLGMFIDTPDIINVNAFIKQNLDLEGVLLPVKNILIQIFRFGLIFILVSIVINVAKKIYMLLKFWNAD